MTITTTNPLCNSGDGSASVTAIGGTGAYSYDWSTGSTTDSETAIYAGQYSLTITDDNGCAYTQNFTITDPAAISTSFTTVAPLCNGGTGEATIQATGGTGNLNIQWSSGGTSTTESNLTAGTYQVQVMDANGCLNNSSVTITEPTAISYNVTVVDEHCNQNNGSISVTANGGTGVLSYNWNNGSSDASISSLAAGTFDFTIYDENGCTIMNQAAVNNIAAPTASAITSNVLCNGDQNGTIDLTVNGGSSNYSYTWSNGEITEDLIALAAGIYDYTVTDDANCSTTGSITISEPSPLTATFVSTNETTGNDGSIDLTVNGGTPAYTYSWDNGSTTEDLSGLTAGTYVVVITDGNGCNTSTTVDITSTVGIFNPNNDIQAINISPNPSNGTIVIKGLPYGEYAIYDAAGRLIKSFTANETQIKLNLDALSNGLYSIRNLSGIETRAGRFIISK
jgi:VCBS repeat-containing protein